MYRMDINIAPNVDVLNVSISLSAIQEELMNPLHVPNARKKIDCVTKEEERRNLMYRMDINIVPNVEIHTVSISLSAHIQEELNPRLRAKTVEIVQVAQKKIRLQN